MSGIGRLFIVSIAPVLMFAGSAAAQDESIWGQTIITTRPSVSVAASGARAPGGMVNAGVARTLANVQQAQGIIEITEPFEPDVLDEFRVEAFDILVEQITEFVFYIGNLLLERAGLPAIDIPDAGGNDDDDGETDNPRDPKPSR